MLSVRKVYFEEDGSVHVIEAVPQVLSAPDIDKLSEIASSFMVACKHPVIRWEDGEECQMPSR